MMNDRISELLEHIKKESPPDAKLTPVKYATGKVLYINQEQKTFIAETKDHEDKIYITEIPFDDVSDMEGEDIKVNSPFEWIEYYEDYGRTRACVSMILFRQL